MLTSYFKKKHIDVNKQANHEKNTDEICPR